ncbi:MAG: ABC transporter ATP-binding protein [Nitrospinota bacterium]
MSALRPKMVVEDARKVYGQRVVALDGMSIEVYEEEILCVLGPSGCGKTTLLRSMNGLISLDGGRILLDGVEVTGPRREMAMVFQHFGLFPWKRLQQNIGYGLLLQGKRREVVREKVAHYTRLVGLEGFESHFPYQLSGGMQQRAGLARALAIEPEVLLMDEPFGALDAQTRELLQEELLRIYEAEPKTIVFITHSIDEAILLGDRVAVMTPRPGRVRELLRVELPRPRRIAEVRGSRIFAELRNYIWNLLRSGNGREAQLPRGA